MHVFVTVTSVAPSDDQSIVPRHYYIYIGCAVVIISMNLTNRHEMDRSPESISRMMHILQTVVQRKYSMIWRSRIYIVFELLNPTMDDNSGTNAECNTA